MIKNTAITILVIVIIYLYYQNRKLKMIPATSQTLFELDEDLIAEKDEAVRKKNEAEQEVLSLSNKLKLKNQEVTRKDQENERLKQEKSQVEISLNKKISERKEKIKELEQEKTQLLREISKHQDLDDFQTWLSAEETRKANLPDWDKIITELKDKIRDYHLQEGNWASGLFKRNGNYWAVFKEWLDSDYD